MGAEHQDYIATYDNIFSETECNFLIEKFHDLEDGSWFSDGAVKGESQFLGHGGTLTRKDRSLFFDHQSRKESEFIHDRVGKCMEEYVSKYHGLQGLQIGSVVCKVQRTMPSGGFHVWHNEHGPQLESMKRVAVWLVYLTSHENEGETEFLQQGVRVAPKAGTVVIWPASFTHPHRGNPVYSGDKYIATGWFEFIESIHRMS